MRPPFLKYSYESIGLIINTKLWNYSVSLDESRIY